jgi:hypothetical protein
VPDANLLPAFARVTDVYALRPKHAPVWADERKLRRTVRGVDMSHDVQENIAGSGTPVNVADGRECPTGNEQNDAF